MITKFKRLMLLGVSMLMSTGVFGINFNDVTLIAKEVASEAKFNDTYEMRPLRTELNDLNETIDGFQSAVNKIKMIPADERTASKKDWLRSVERTDLPNLKQRKEQIIKEIDALKKK